MEKGEAKEKKKIAGKNVNTISGLYQSLFWGNKKYRVLLIFSMIGFYIAICSINALHPISLSVKWKVFYDISSAILLSLSTVLIADLIINSNYESRLREYLTFILTNDELMQIFIDSDKKVEIMNTALKVNIGEDVTAALTSVVLNNYLMNNHNAFREDYYCNINIKKYINNFERDTVEEVKTSEYAFIENNLDYVEIYHNFIIPPTNEDVELNLVASDNNRELKASSIAIPRNSLFLFFPFLLADGLENLTLIPYYSATVEVIDEQRRDEVALIKQDVDENKLTIHYKSTIKGKNHPVRISIRIKTFLNKREEFLYDDILCVHKGYHINICFQDELVSNCKCYHSCKSKNLVYDHSKRHAKLDINDIVLPENNFVFIWERDKSE